MSVTISSINKFQKASPSSTLLNDLLCYFKFEETTGTTLYDSTANNIDIIKYGSTAIDQSGKLGRAIAMDGNGDYLYFSNGALNSLNGLEYATFAFWIKLDTLSSTKGSDSIILRLSNTAIPLVSALRISLDTGDKFHFIYNNPSNNQYARYSAAVSDTTNFMHVMCILNGIGNLPEVYVNNSTTGNTGANNLSHVIQNLDGTLMFGSTTTYGTDCTLDEFGIWTRALTSDERAELYNSGTGKTHPFA